jgi:hypothetical protein
MTRYLKAITSLWDANLFFGLMFEVDSGEADVPKMTQMMVPMLLIVIFVFVEIWPIWYVLDGNFIDIFLKYSVLIE